MGIPRHLLPQIPSAQLKDFQKFLEDSGTDTKVCFIVNGNLKPIQAEVNRDKVEALKKDSYKLSQPVIVSRGGYILDGHHRYIASAELNPNGSTICLWVDLPVKQLIEKGHDFDGSFTKTVYETTIYGKQVFEDNTTDPETHTLMVRKTLAPQYE